MARTPISLRPRSSGASMREADWRFLLPWPEGGAFERMAVLGGSAELPGVLSEGGIARQVVGAAGPGEVDAVAVIGRASEAVSEAEAMSMLRSGGILYYEVDRGAGPRVRSPRRSRRAIRAAGGSLIATYWIRPSLAVRQMYVPLDSPEALRWFQKGGFPRQTLPQRIKTSLFGGLIGLGESARFLLARQFGVVARKGKGAAQSSLPGILSDGSLPADVAAPGTRVMLIAKGRRPVVGKVVILPFAPGMAHPAAILKTVRASVTGDAVRAEQAGIRAFRPMLDSESRLAIPDARGIVRVGDHDVAIEEYLPGISLSTEIRRWGVPLRRKVDILRRAAEWITRFGEQAREGDGGWTKARHLAHVEEPVRRYGREFPLTPEESTLLERIVERSESLIGLPLPIVWTHGDYAPWNVVRSGDRLSVFDWEDAAPGLPLVDLINFCRIWYKDVVALAGGGDRVAEILPFLPGYPKAGSIEALIDESIETYLRNMKIDSGYRPIALVVPRMVRAVERAEWAREMGDDPGQVVESRKVIWAFAAHQDLLFGGSGVGGRDRGPAVRMFE